MNTSIFVLLGLVVILYIWTMYVKQNSEAMTMFNRYRPLMTGNPAPLDFDENIAGIPYYNSTQELPNVNQYSNDLAFNPNNPNSANYMENGVSVMNQEAYQYLGNRD
jgi:hypothetical protein